MEFKRASKVSFIVVTFCISLFTGLLQAETKIKLEPYVTPTGDELKRLPEDIERAKQCAAVFEGPIESGPVEPTKESILKMECPDWFKDAKFGIWSHWGPCSVSEFSSNYGRDMYIPHLWGHKEHVKRFGHPTVVGYKDIIKYWTAENWEPEKLMKKYKAAGARYFVSIARHHDNFDLYDSKYTPWNSVNMGPKKDVVGIWRKAALKEGLRFGLSVHERDDYFWNYRVHPNPKKYDSYNSDYWSLYLAPPEIPGAKKEFLDGFYARLKDALDKYHPDLLYFDGGIGGGESHGYKILAHYFNSNIKRNGGVNQAVLNTKKGGGGVLDLERHVMNDIYPKPWQDDTSSAGWYYMRQEATENELYAMNRSSTTLLHLLIDVVSKNGNLLLNIPQKADGTLDEHGEILLEDFAEWMAINDVAIFETRPWKVFGEGPGRPQGHDPRRDRCREWKTPMTSKDIRFTQSKDGKTVYMFVLGVPRDTIRVKSMANENIAAIRLLGSKREIEWRQTGNELEIDLLSKYPCRHSVVFEVTLKE